MHQAGPRPRYRTYDHCVWFDLICLFTVKNMLLRKNHTLFHLHEYCLSSFSFQAILSSCCFPDEHEDTYKSNTFLHVAVVPWLPGSGYMLKCPWARKRTPKCSDGWPISVQVVLWMAVYRNIEVIRFEDAISLLIHIRLATCKPLPSLEYQIFESNF